jgi:hypothetical protein
MEEKACISILGKVKEHAFLRAKSSNQFKLGANLANSLSFPLSSFLSVIIAIRIRGS